MFQLRKYHGERVQSLTYDDGKKAFSVGIISPGEYEFGAIKEEVTTVTSGKISVWVEGSEKWQDYSAHEAFTIPGHKNFRYKVEETSSYICFYE
jgi:uncharacterized protein YaiE (UPF0345 family)